MKRFGVFGTTVVLFFLAEMGDKTQLATGALAAKFPAEALWVISGTTLAETIRIRRRIWGVMRVASTAPTPPAIAWLRTVATRMPQMMGAGLRNLAARQMAMSMVLSPISLAVTTPVPAPAPPTTPEILRWILIVSFAAMAAWMLVPDKLDDEETGEVRRQRRRARRGSSCPAARPG